MEFDRNAVFPSSPQEPGAQEAGPGYPAAQAFAHPVGTVPAPGCPAAYPPPHGPAYPAPPATLPVAEGTPVARALQASLVWAGVVMVLVFAVDDVSLSGHAFGTVLGRLLPISVFSGLLVRLFFKRKRVAFGWLVLASLPTFAVSFVVVGLLLLAGQSVLPR